MRQMYAIPIVHLLADTVGHLCIDQSPLGDKCARCICSPRRIKETHGDRWHDTLLAWHANINWPFISNFSHFLGVSSGTITLARLAGSAFFLIEKHKALIYHFNLVPLVCFWKTVTVKHVYSPL